MGPHFNKNIQVSKLSDRLGGVMGLQYTYSLNHIHVNLTLLWLRRKVRGLWDAMHGWGTDEYTLSALEPCLHEWFLLFYPPGQLVLQPLNP